MYEILQHDRTGIAGLLENAKKEALAFLQNIDTIPTSTAYTAERQRDLERTGMGARAVLEEFQEGSGRLW